LLQAARDLCEPAPEHLLMLKFLHEHGYGIINKSVIQYAIKSGHTGMIRWLHQQASVLFDVEIMRLAASYGRLEMCEALYELQCPWDASACTTAAKAHNQHAVRWLHEHGCPWDARELYVSTVYQPSSLLNYMKSEGVHWTTEELTDMLQQVGTIGSLETSKWLRNEGAEWPTILKYGDLQWVNKTVKWAKEAG
jgi:hypothetical protein